MKMSRWHERLLESTRGRVLALLQTSDQTVRELANELQLTLNAVRAHLISLERDGFVRRTGTKGGLRRPHVTYGVSQAAEQIFPRAYGPLLNSFMAITRKRLGLRGFRFSLRELGRRIAQAYPSKVRGRKRAERINSALSLLKELGGTPRICQSKGKLVIRSNRCPLAAATVEHPEACLVAESLLHELIGGTVQENCQRGPNPSCRFEIY